MTDLAPPAPTDAAAPSPRAAAGKIRVRLLYAQGSIGPGKISLLEGIARSGSISAAARDLDMTFRRGWQLLETMNQLFGVPVVKTVTGGKAGGGATLTPFGEELVARFRALESAAASAAAPHLAWLDGIVTAPGNGQPSPAGQDHENGRADDADHDD